MVKDAAEKHKTLTSGLVVMMSDNARTQELAGPGHSAFKVASTEEPVFASPTCPCSSPMTGPPGIELGTC